MAREQYAANFYAGASDRAIREMLIGFEPPELPAPPAAGLVPHAGWTYSGAVAAKVFQTIKSYREPEAFVLFGTVHRRVPSNSVYARGSWSTPMGDVAVDEGLANQLIEYSDGLLDGNESAHNGEHSIEVQMPFLKHFFPEAKAVPISVLPNADAAPMGNLAGKYIRDNNIDAVVIGTTDLTHYGEAYGFTPAGQGPEAHEWMKKNDAGIINLAREMRSGEIVPEARESMNACGAGAMAATVAAAASLGCASGLTIDYTTSYDVVSERTFRMAVGYVGMIFCPS
jgi:AmmeMemoRadiSam system protein B